MQWIIEFLIINEQYLCFYDNICSFICVLFDLILKVKGNGDKIECCSVVLINRNTNFVGDIKS